MDLLEFLMELDILVLLDLEKYDAIYFRTRYLLSLNSDFKQ